jgi:hypothetical protein
MICISGPPPGWVETSGDRKAIGLAREQLFSGECALSLADCPDAVRLFCAAQSPYFSAFCLRPRQGRDTAGPRPSRSHWSLFRWRGRSSMRRRDRSCGMHPGSLQQRPRRRSEWPTTRPIVCGRARPAQLAKHLKRKRTREPDRFGRRIRLPAAARQRLHGRKSMMRIKIKSRNKKAGESNNAGTDRRYREAEPCSETGWPMRRRRRRRA